MAVKWNMSNCPASYSCNGIGKDCTKCKENREKQKEEHKRLLALAERACPGYIKAMSPGSLDIDGLPGPYPNVPIRPLDASNSDDFFVWLRQKLLEQGLNYDGTPITK